MLAHAWPGDAAFAACLRLFRQYPLAVRRHYAEHRYGSMVLMTRDAGKSRFFVLIMEWDDLFVLRHWDRRDGARAEIGRDEPVSADVRQVIEAGVPVPRDGALLGWVTGHQVRAVLAAYGRLPEPWDDASAVPGVLVMPHSGASRRSGRRWPPARWTTGSCGSTSPAASSRTSRRSSPVRPDACSWCPAGMGGRAGT